MKRKEIIQHARRMGKTRMGFFLRIQGEKNLWYRGDYYIKINAEREWMLVE